MKLWQIFLIMMIPYINGQVCPEGFFSSKGSTQCFKLVDTVRRTWDEAKKTCENESLTLAQPSDEGALELRQSILNTYPQTFPDNGGGAYDVWLGARRDGPGGEVQWLDGTALPDKHQLWHSGQGPDSWTTYHCLRMVVWPRAVRTYQDTTYSVYRCSWELYTLCEAENTE